MFCSLKNCKCHIRDSECDFGFSRYDNNGCEHSSTLKAPEHLRLVSSHGALCKQERFLYHPDQSPLSHFLHIFGNPDAKSDSSLLRWQTVHWDSVVLDSLAYVH